MQRFVPAREASKILGLHANTLRKYADEGRISAFRTASGQRRYDVESFLGTAAVEGPRAVVCYCRVSSHAQKPDLERQVQAMQERFPEAEIVQDIGSALNYQRKGLKSLLGRCLRGEKFQIVVAHKDRLVRFGFELIEWIVRECGSELLVLSADKREPERELAEDLLAIVHVFSCRLCGRRNYKSKKNQDVANAVAREATELVDRRLQVRLQRNDLAAEPSDCVSEFHGDQEIPDSVSGGRVPLDEGVPKGDSGRGCRGGMSDG